MNEKFAKHFKRTQKDDPVACSAAIAYANGMKYKSAVVDGERVSEVWWRYGGKSIQLGRITFDEEFNPTAYYMQYQFRYHVRYVSHVICRVLDALTPRPVWSEFSTIRLPRYVMRDAQLQADSKTVLTLMQYANATGAEALLPAGLEPCAFKYGVKPSEHGTYWARVNARKSVGRMLVIPGALYRYDVAENRWTGPHNDVGMRVARCDFRVARAHCAKVREAAQYAEATATIIGYRPGDMVRELHASSAPYSPSVLDSAASDCADVAFALGRQSFVAYTRTSEGRAGGSTPSIGFRRPPPAAKDGWVTVHSLADIYAFAEAAK